MSLSAAQIVELLGLGPHPTCGLVLESYLSESRIPESALPPGYTGGRHLGGALYFLVTPEAPVRLHRIRSDQMYHHYLGDPLDVLLLHPEGPGEVRVLGRDLAGGMRPQLLIPGGAFHAGRTRGPAGYALLGTSVWLRAEPADVEMGDARRLSELYPAAAADIAAFAR